MNFPYFNHPERYYFYTKILCCLVVLNCIIVLAGWAYEIPILISIKAGFYQMKVNTAVGVLLGSAALWLQAERHGRLRGTLSRAMASLMLALGLFTLLEYLFGLNVGIDEALASDWLDASGAHPGRMSVATAAGMVMTGLALIFMSRDARSAWSLWPATLSTIAWSGLAVSYLYGLTSIYRFDAYGGISIPTIASFILLNIGILLANAQRGFVFYFTNLSHAGLVARRMLPAAVLGPVLLGWLVLAAHDSGLTDIRVALAVETLLIALGLTALIGWCARMLLSLERLASMRQAEKMEALERAARLAHYDALTGLPNRALLQERLTESIKSAERRSGTVALLFVDLDRFKPINDTYGHRAGDRVLMEISSRLQKTVRESDTVARLGGDEFVVLLNDTRPDHAAAIAGKLIKTIEEPYWVENQEMYLSASIGISAYPKDGPQPAVLMERADAAMYYAKSLGKHNYQFYAPHMTHEALRRASIERMLRTALDEDGVTVEYQPKVAVQNGRLIGFEALARLKPVDGRPPVSPNEFIPIAEDTGLIVPLGRKVLIEACRQNRAWQEAGLIPLPVSVNVSAAQFRNNDFAATVREALATAGLPPSYLDLEITETTVMQNFDTAIELMQQLQALGISVSIDDFGTGSSSLSKLKLFPADTLKIDRSFIRDLPHDKDDAAITSAIIELARHLNQKVVAEGVENVDQYAFLQEHGCDEVQGFYFSEPLSPQRFEAMYGRQW